MYRTLVDQIANARTPSSRGYREPGCADPARTPGLEVGEGSFVAAARIRAALQESPTPLTPTELARRLGIEPRALTPLLAGATYACATLYETDKGRLGLLGKHDD